MHGTPIATIVGLLALSACAPQTPPQGDLGQDMVPVEAKFSSLKPIFTRSCVFSSCHSDANLAYGDLKLSGTEAYCSLAGPTGGATYRATAKADFPRRVQAGDRGKSFLYKKFLLMDSEMGPTKAYGSRMPLGATLEADEIDLFGRWIDAGAKDDTAGASPCM